MGVVASGLLILSSLFLYTAMRQEQDLASIRERALMVRNLGLTDLCLFTEARYTRHPSQADLHSAFQESPLSLEHFPSGSLLAPPLMLRERHANVD